jgi:hypothetical protein
MAFAPHFSAVQTLVGRAGHTKLLSTLYRHGQACSALNHRYVCWWQPKPKGAGAHWCTACTPHVCPLPLVTCRKHVLMAKPRQSCIRFQTSAVFQKHHIRHMTTLVLMCWVGVGRMDDVQPVHANLRWHGRPKGVNRSVASTCDAELCMTNTAKKDRENELRLA